MTPRPSHTSFVGGLVDLVREHGAAAALTALRAERPALRDGRYHDTEAVFFVWAVERLLDAGLTRTAVLWHPLVHADSPAAWWSTEVLDSAEAFDHFVVPTGLAAGEPCPLEPRDHLVAA